MFFCKIGIARHIFNLIFFGVSQLLLTQIRVAASEMSVVKYLLNKFFSDFKRA
jgi:hypothetical protein